MKMYQKQRTLFYLAEWSFSHDFSQIHLFRFFLGIFGWMRISNALDIWLNSFLLLFNKNLKTNVIWFENVQKMILVR